MSNFCTEIFGPVNFLTNFKSVFTQNWTLSVDSVLGEYWPFTQNWTRSVDSVLGEYWLFTQNWTRSEGSVLGEYWPLWWCECCYRGPTHRGAKSADSIPVPKQHNQLVLLLCMTVCLYKFEYTVAHLCQSLLVVWQALGAFSASSYLVQVVWSYINSVAIINVVKKVKIIPYKLYKLLCQRMSHLYVSLWNYEEKKLFPKILNVFQMSNVVIIR